jgi:predicted transcriptional regulator/KaiC/GvpD/RAD55 family RecA-like ATPase
LSEEKKRSKYDIYADIIEVVARRSECSLTRVSYGANLSVGRARKILDLLVSHGFVEKTAAAEAPNYKATKWGLGFLETYRRMRKFLAALEQPMKISPMKHVLPDRVPTGHEALDNLLFGGIPENYAVILVSPSCDERQSLVKSYLETGLRDKNIVFDITTDASGFKNLLEEFQSTFYLFICNPQAEEIIESSRNVFKLKGVANLNDINIALTLALRQLNLASKTQKRACIEIVSDVLLQHRALDTRRWLSMLLPELKSNGFTTLAIMNPYMHTTEETQAIIDLFEGEISIFERGSTEGAEKTVKVRKLYNQRYLEFEMPLSKENLD